jgi:hypothetical protein
MLDVLEKIDEGAGIRPGEEVLVILDALRNSVQARTYRSLHDVESYRA